MQHSLHLQWETVGNSTLGISSVCNIPYIYIGKLLVIPGWSVQISNRLMLALSLLKKEYELSKLQQKIGKEVK